MLLSDVLPKFNGNKARLASALGITRAAVHQWAASDRIPEKQALRLKYEVLPYLDDKGSHCAEQDTRRNDK